MQFRVLAVLPLCALALLGCGGPSALYRPYSGTFGYSEVNIAKNRYEVYFYGPPEIEDASAKQYAIVRAAEIGKQNGYSHFRVATSRIRRETSQEVRRDSELFPADPWSPTFGTRAEREQRAWERQRRTRVITKESPVAQLAVQYFNEDCSDCLSVQAKLDEAVRQGTLAKPKP